MQTRDDIAKFLERQPYIMTLLAAMQELGIEDCWVGAGLIRNAVWDLAFPLTQSLAVMLTVYCDSNEASLA